MPQRSHSRQRPPLGAARHPAQRLHRSPDLPTPSTPTPLARFLALAFGAATLAWGPAHAQTPTPTTAPASAPSTEKTALPAVTVTAQKREESAQEVPTAITVLSGDDLLDQGIGRSASEVLNYVPNASAGTQQHGRPRWWIRGVGAGQQQIDLASPVGFYLDEVYISNNTATGYPLFDLDRVEVLRGPQGTLWGKNTTGGAVSVLSKKPSFDADGYVKVDYGSYRDTILEGAVGGAIKDDVLAGRFSFHAEDQAQGRFHNLFTGAQDGGLRDNALRGQLLAKVSPDFEALLNLHYRDYKSTGAITSVASYLPSGLYRNGYIPSTNQDDVSSNAPNSTAIQQNGANLNLKWQLGRLTLTSITGYEDFDTEVFSDGDNTPLEVNRGHTAAHSKQWSQEFRLASPREDRLSWVSGFHYFDESIHSDAASARLPNGSVPALSGSSAPVAFSDTVYDHTARSYALFGSTNWRATDQVNTTLGLRYTRETKSLNIRRLQAANGTATFADVSNWWNLGSVGANYTAASVASGNFAQQLDKTWNNFTYDITPEYEINKNSRAYFKYAHGVKSGGFNTAAADIRALNTVEPETLNSYEVGYKSEWLNRRLTFNATAFHYNYNNVQVNVVGLFNGTTAISYLQNVQKAHSDGVELELEALVTDRFHVKGSLGLLRTRFDSFDIMNNGGNRDGNEFVRSPHATALLAADYRLPVDNGGTVVLGGDAHYTSSQYYYVDPQSAGQRGGPMDYLKQAPYTILNLRAAYSTPGEKQTVTFYVNNATDKQYLNHSLPAYSAAQGVTGDVIYAGARRTLGVSLVSRW